MSSSAPQVTSKVNEHGEISYDVYSDSSQYSSPGVNPEDTESVSNDDASVQDSGGSRHDAVDQSHRDIPD